MREISNHFAIIPAELICEALKMGENISLPVGSKEYSCPGKIIFDQSASINGAGMSFDATFRAVTTDESVCRYNKAKLYVGLIFTDGTIEIIGDAWNVPVVTVTPHQNVFVVETSITLPHAISL